MPVAASTVNQGLQGQQAVILANATQNPLTPHFPEQRRLAKWERSAF
jgi:hypothetical protein